MSNTAPALKGTAKGMTFGVFIATSFMLFSMYFGAGNLIFPPMLGLQAGESFAPAMIGFLIAGVALPVLAIIAIAISGANMRDLASRGGYIFGLVFPVLAYLSIGAFYALPRTGAVSFSTAIQPLTGWDSTLASGVFNFIFFGIALALAYNPTSIVNKLGKFLTPALLILLVVLIVIAVTKFDGTPGAPAEDYAENPMAAGLLQGYLTMDSIAGLAFGIVVISALRYSDIPEGASRVRGTIWCGIGAGVLLALIYLGLGFIGTIIPDGEKYADGAELLAGASNLTMGMAGQIIFGLIVLLACMTTAVGLIAATSEFFALLLPGVTYKVWAVLFAVMSFGMATMGLETVLAIAAPVVSFIYPPAITLILITLIEPLVRKKTSFYWTFRLALWVAVIWSAVTVAIELGVTSFSPVVDWAPMQDLTLGWVLPVAVAFLVGVILDFTTDHPQPQSALVQAMEEEEQAEEAGVAAE